MAEAAHRSITRRSMVAGSAAVPVAALRMPGREAVQAQTSDLAETPPDPVHAAIAAHARAYAAYQAQLKADGADDLAMESLCDAERKAADALSATVPATLAGAVTSLAYVRLLHERDDYPMLDDFGCYVLIASIETGLRRQVGG